MSDAQIAADMFTRLAREAQEEGHDLILYWWLGEGCTALPLSPAGAPVVREWSLHGLRRDLDGRETYARMKLDRPGLRITLVEIGSEVLH